MNKTLLTSICVAGLTSAASAFTLDLTTLNDSVIGDLSITQEGALFNLTESVIAPPSTDSGQITTGSSGRISITVNENSTVIIDYDETKVSYSGVFNPFGYALVDDGTKLTLGTGSYSDFEFNAVPEPSSTALLGLGGLALILRRRK
ncbi:MAG: PEP-CTERM sorting domain-containing protein [Akkermansiaceae bacterium]